MDTLCDSSPAACHDIPGANRELSHSASKWKVFVFSSNTPLHLGMLGVEGCRRACFRIVRAGYKGCDWTEQEANELVLYFNPTEGDDCKFIDLKAMAAEYCSI